MRVQTASHEVGNEVRIVAAQMAAETPGVKFEMVDVEIGDTSLPPAPVAGGSNSTASVRYAVIKACKIIRDKGLHAAVTANAGPLAGKDVNTLTIRNDKIAFPTASQTVIDVIAKSGDGAIEQY